MGGEQGALRLRHQRRLHPPWLRRAVEPRPAEVHLPVPRLPVRLQRQGHPWPGPPRSRLRTLTLLTTRSCSPRGPRPTSALTPPRGGSKLFGVLQPCAAPGLATHRFMYRGLLQRRNTSLSGFLLDRGQRCVIVASQRISQLV